MVPFKQEYCIDAFFKRLASAADKAENELIIKPSKEEAGHIIKKIHDAIKEVKNNKSGKTLAIFVSKVAKKIY